MITRIILAFLVTIYLIPSSHAGSQSPLPEWAAISPSEWPIYYESLPDHLQTKKFDYTRPAMLWTWEGIEDNQIHIIDSSKKEMSFNLFDGCIAEPYRYGLFNQEGNTVALNIKFNHKFDYSKLKPLTHLKTLTIRGTALDRVSIDLEEADLPDSIEALCFNYVNIKSIKALSKLKKLKYLSVRGSQFSAIDFPKLPILEGFHFVEWATDNLPGILTPKEADILLSKFPNLKHLNIGHLESLNDNLMLNLSKQSPKLKTLIVKQIVNETPLSNLSFLSSFKQLKELDLDKEDLSSIDELPTIPTLEKLTMLDTRLSDLSSIGRFSNLKEVDFGSGQIKDMSAFASLPNLENLRLHRNKITKIQGLHNSPNLKSLFLMSNDLQGLEGLEKNINLESLIVSGAGFRKLDPITHLTNLKNLEITKCNVDSTIGLPATPTLTKVSIDCSPDLDMSGIAKLPNLLDFYCIPCDESALEGESKKAYEEYDKRSTAYYRKLRKQERQRRRNLKKLYLEHRAKNKHIYEATSQ